MAIREHESFPSAPASGNDQVFILNFHGLGEPAGELPSRDEAYWVAPRIFSGVLEAAGKRRDVEITFDDSNESDYAVALPLLQTMRRTARFFVLAGRIGQTGSLSAKQVQALCAAGMTIGNHGMHHRRWPDLNDQELHQELVEARDRIEQITGVRIVEAACPFGGYNRRVLRQLRIAGYEKVYTSDGGPATPASWIQPRNTIVRSHDLEKVESIINRVPSSPKQAWRRLKLALKRWR